MIPHRTPIASALAALFALSPLVSSAQTNADSGSAQAGAVDKVSQANTTPAAGTSAPAAGTPAAPASDATRTPQSLRPVEVRERQVRDDFNAGYNSSISRLPADLKDIPQSVTVVNQALMQSQGATSLADALRNVPGITIGGAEGGQIGNNINLNGFSARTDLYYDGFRDRGQYYRDVFALDSIEVLMGPSSMLFGRGSTGGVINQVSKKPTLRTFGEGTATLTSNGLIRTTVDYNQPLSETSAFRIAGMGQYGRPSTRDQMQVHDIGLAPSLKLGINTPTTITLSALLQRNNDQPDYGVGNLNGRPYPVDRQTFYGYNTDNTRQSVGALNATIEHKLTPITSIRNQTQYNYVRTEAYETAPNAVGTVGAAGFTATPASTLPLSLLFVRLQSHDRTIRDQSIYNQTELTTKFETGSLKHTLLGGVELGYDNYKNQNSYRPGSCNGVPLNAAGTTAGYVSCVPLVNPTYGDSPTTVPSINGNLQGGRATTLAGYVNDTVEVVPTVKVVGGLRYDRYDATITNSLNSGNTAGNTALARAQQTVHFTSVRLGPIWQPTPAQSYYISYGTSFNPSLEQLVGTAGQQNLDPEKNKSYELGGKWDLAGADLSLNAALFRIQKDNARSQTSPGIYELQGNVRVDGFRTGIAGRLSRNWQIFTGYTYLDGKVVSASATDGTLGKVPANTPKHTVALWTTYQPLPGWEVGGGAYYMSSRYVVANNTVEVSGYTRFDATVAYRQPKWDLRLNVFNLTNKMYYDALIPSDGGRSVPGIGRTAMLTLAYRL